MRFVRRAFLLPVLIAVLATGWSGTSSAQAGEDDAPDTVVQGTLSATIDGERQKIEGVTIRNPFARP